MANTLVQFRADDLLKIKATQICNNLGIDLSTYFRICMARLVREQGIPFSMKLTEQVTNGQAALMAMRAAGKIAEENGIADLTLEEINAEIHAARAGE